MAKQQQVASQNDNGHDEDVMSYEQELSEFLQERIKPGLNSGSIPLLARSIAKEIARRDPPEAASEDAEAEDEFIEDEADDEPSGEADDAEIGDEAEDDFDEEADGDEPRDEAEDEAEDEEFTDEADEEYADDLQPPDYAEMQDVQADLGEEWILRFSVQGDDAWLTAEKDDGSQRLEAPNVAVLVEAVELLNESGGRSG